MVYNLHEVPYPPQSAMLRLKDIPNTQRQKVLFEPEQSFQFTSMATQEHFHGIKISHQLRASGVGK